MIHPFLTARWSDVVLVNFKVPSDLLLPHVPPGSELDTPDRQPDLHLLSLVALRFKALRVYGIPVPFAQDFPEVNVRFHVRCGAVHAAVFLREFVPSSLVILGAHLLYNQPYRRAALTHQVTTRATHIDVTTTFATHDHHGMIRLRARNTPYIPPHDSEEHFLKEQYWSIDESRCGRSFRYRVMHPVWRTFPIEAAAVTIDPGMILGGPWRTIDWHTALYSVLLVEGSEVAVYKPEPLQHDQRRRMRPWPLGWT